MQTLLLIMVAALLVAAAAALWIGSRRQQRELAAQVGQLVRSATSEVPEPPTPDLDSLPAPVARYLRWALPQPQTVRIVRMRQVGMLRTDVESSRWMTFEAEHTAAPHAVGFVWNARVAIGPLLHVRVRDAFLGGKGSGHVSALSAFTVAEDAGTAEMNSGSLHRFLAEAVWYPTALVPSGRLEWSPIDSNKALATLTVHDVSVSLEFRFADTGEVTGIYAPRRWGTFSGGYEQRPWEGHFRNYQARGGIRVPTEGDVGWYVEHEWHPVWRGAITSFEALPAS